MTELHATELLERVTADLQPSTDLVAGGIAAGRRRRRLGLALSAAGAVAAMAVAGGALASSPGQAPDDQRSVVADGSASPSPSVPSTSHAPPTDQGPPTSASGFAPAPSEMAGVLATLLDGTVTEPRNWHRTPSRPDGYQAGAVLLDGAQVAVILQHATLPDVLSATAGCGETPPIATCEQVGEGFLSTGTVEETSLGGPTGVIGTSVTWYLDAFSVTATAFNASAEKGREPVMDQPVLGVAALTALVQDPAWLAP